MATPRFSDDPSWARDASTASTADCILAYLEHIKDEYKEDCPDQEAIEEYMRCIRNLTWLLAKKP